MKKYLLALFLLFLFSSFAQANPGVTIGMLGSGSVVGGTTVCYGWANTDCVPDSVPSYEDSIQVNKTLHRASWTSTVAGTIDAIYFYTGDDVNTPDYIRADVMRYLSGSTWEPICQATPASSSFTANTLYRVPTTAGDCTIAVDDVLRFGFGVDLGADDFSTRYNETGGDGLYFLWYYNTTPINITTYQYTSGIDMFSMIEVTVSE